MELTEWIARKRVEASQRGPVPTRDVTPSRRDFTTAVTTQKRALSVVIEPTAPFDPLAFAGLCDSVNASALSIPTDAIALGGDERSLRALRSDSPLPLVARDLSLSPESLYCARLNGADAVWLVARALDAGALKRQIEIAASMHMASAVEVDDALHLRAAITCGARVVVFPTDPAVPFLLEQTPRTLTTLVRGAFAEASALEPFRGKADGVWLMLSAGQRAAAEAFLSQFVEAAENG